MLSGDLFTAADVRVEEGKLSAVIHWNKAHPVFAGHFPGQPVVPGVCMLQLVEELLEQALGMSLQLKEAGNLKFLHVIDPSVHQVVNLAVSYRLVEGLLTVAATLQQESLVFFKMNGAFVAEVEG